MSAVLWFYSLCRMEDKQNQKVEEDSLLSKIFLNIGHNYNDSIYFIFIFLAFMSLIHIIESDLRCCMILRYLQVHKSVPLIENGKL